MPIVLAVSEDDKVRLENNKAIVLRYKGVAKAILRRRPKLQLIGRPPGTVLLEEIECLEDPPDE